MPIVTAIVSEPIPDDLAVVSPAPLSIPLDQPTDIAVRATRGGTPIHNRRLSISSATAGFTIGPDTTPGTAADHVVRLTPAVQGAYPGGLVVQDLDTLLTRTIDVVIAAPLGPAPDIDEQFNYADRATILSLADATPVAPYLGSSVNYGMDSGGIHIPYPATYPNQLLKTIDLDNTDAPPGSSSGKCVVYTWPNRADPSFIPNGLTQSPPGLCHDYTITLGDIGYGAVAEVWLSIWVKFSADFTSLVPVADYFNSPAGTNCQNLLGISPGLKFFFPGGTDKPNISRIGSYFHVDSLFMDWPSLNCPSGAVYNGPFNGDAGLPWAGHGMSGAAIAETLNFNNGLRQGPMPFAGNGWFEIRYYIRSTRLVTLPPAGHIFESGTCQSGSLSQAVLKSGGGAGVIPHTVPTGQNHTDTKCIFEFPSGRYYQVVVAGFSGAGTASPTITQFRAPTNLPAITQLTNMPPGVGPVDSNTKYYLSDRPLVGDGAVYFQIMGVMSKPIGLNDLVTGTDTTQDALLTTGELVGQAGGLVNQPRQVFTKCSLNRNMNQGPAFEGQQQRYGRVTVWKNRPVWADPALGWAA